MTPRGLRNNNPLNIRRGGSQWQGLKREQADSQFCQFTTMAYGWRAAFVLLTRTYYHKYRLFTIEGIINRWAPPRENDTRAYVDTVSGLMNYDKNLPLGIPSTFPTRWMRLAVAMSIVENGTKAFDYFAMLDGWDMAAETIRRGDYT